MTRVLIGMTAEELLFVGFMTLMILVPMINAVHAEEVPLLMNQLVTVMILTMLVQILR